MAKQKRPKAAKRARRPAPWMPSANVYARLCGDKEFMRDPPPKRKEIDRG